MTYGEFWPRYLAAHADRRTRALHYAGTGAAALIFIVFLITRNWWWLVAVPFAGYGFAWIGHAAFEGNRPETFSHPFWSLYGDVRMLFLFLAGRIGGETRRVRDKR